MIELVPIKVGEGYGIGISARFPQTHLLAIVMGNGYLMCGMLDVAALDRFHPEREIIAARAVGVKSFGDLLAAKVESCTRKAREVGVVEGMTGRDALLRMVQGDRGGG